MCLQISRRDLEHFQTVHTRLCQSQIPGLSARETATAERVEPLFKGVFAQQTNLTLDHETQCMVTRELKLSRHCCVRTLFHIWELFLKIITFGCYKTHRERTLARISQAINAPYFEQFVHRHIESHSGRLDRSQYTKLQRNYSRQLECLMDKQQINLASHLLHRYLLVDRLIRDNEVSFENHIAQHNTLSHFFNPTSPTHLKKSHHPKLVGKVMKLNARYQRRLVNLYHKSGHELAAITPNNALSRMGSSTPTSPQPANA